MNKLKLKGAIAESGLTCKDIAPLVGMSKKTLSSRINGKSAFRTDEIERLCYVLKIEEPERKIEIFLD